MNIVKFIASKISVGSFTNKNEWKKQPFAQLNRYVLRDHKQVLIDRMFTAGVDGAIVELFSNAFTYFMNHPEKYDGASGDVELHKVGNNFYDISGILHDWLDAINYTYSWTDLKNADKLLVKVMDQLGDPRVHRDKRAGLLWIIAPVRFWFSRKRRESNHAPDTDIYFAIEKYVDPYKVDYTGFIKYSGVAVMLAIVSVTHQAFPWLYKTISSLT